MTKTVLITQGFFVIAKQCLHRVKDFSASHNAVPVSRLGVHMELRGDTSGTADIKWPKEYPILYDVILSNKRWRKNKEGEDIQS